MVKLMIIKTRVFNTLAATRIRVKVVLLLPGHPPDQVFFFLTASAIRKQK